MFVHFISLWCQVFHLSIIWRTELELHSTEIKPILIHASSYKETLCVCVLTQLCSTLCDPMDCSLSVHGIIPARILEWVAISFSRRSSGPGDWIPSLLGLLHWLVDSLPSGKPRGTLGYLYYILKKVLDSFFYVFYWNSNIHRSFFPWALLGGNLDNITILSSELL